MAIKEHRELVASNQAVYEEWERAVSDPDVLGSVLDSLQAEYLRRLAKTTAQQEVLADLIETLGYVPDVAPAAFD